MNEQLRELLGESAADAQQRPATPQAQGVSCELLVFEYGSERYAVAASQVDAVIAWHEPAPVPGASASISGVLQDRGRVIVLLMHPTGQSTIRGDVEQRRIVICKTERGLVGLPASGTSSVATVTLPTEPTRGSLQDSPFGAFTYLDPQRWLHER